MKNKISLGLDYWYVAMEPLLVLEQCRMKNFQIYDVQLKNGGVLFYAPVYERFSILHTFEACTLKKTTGILGYLFRSLKQPYRIIAVCVSISLWYVLSNTVFLIEFQGDDVQVRTLIQEQMQALNYTLPLFQVDEQTLKTDLKEQLRDKISWLEIEKIGSKLKIYYTPKEFAEEKVIGDDVLVAQMDGVIQRFDITHGNKVVNVNQVVHKGDILVSNEMEDSNGEIKHLNVEGRVFAYTWKDVTVTMEDQGLPMFFVYFDLLLEARRQVAETFHQDDYIDQENILQFSKEEGTIKMVIHYTLVQDITTP